jgi:hypothetical protein
VSRSSLEAADNSLKSSSDSLCVLRGHPYDSPRAILWPPLQLRGMCSRGRRTLIISAVPQVLLQSSDCRRDSIRVITQCRR